MRKFILQKDLPTFKAGDVFYLSNFGSLATEDGTVVAYHKTTLEKFPNILSDEWFKEVREPLLINEKHRIAALAWANANSATSVEVDGDHRLIIIGPDETFWLEFVGEPFAYIQNGIYTINELCGEE